MVYSKRSGDNVRTTRIRIATRLAIRLVAVGFQLFILSMLMGCSKNWMNSFHPILVTSPQVIVLMGQSNMVRFTPSGEHGFMAEWQRMNPTSTVRFINCAIGGTPIAMWASNYVDACASGIDAKVTAVFFYQGEAEAASGNPWGPSFVIFRAKVRGYWGNIPLFYARLDSPNGVEQYKAYWAAVRDEQTNAGDANTLMIDTDDLPTDGLHLYPDSERLLGVRFAQHLQMYFVR